MAVDLVFPHTIGKHWEVIGSALCNVHWTPQNLISAIDKIRTSSYKQVKDMPSSSRFSGLLQFLKDPYHLAGDPTLFWGDQYFGHHNPNSNVKGWFFAHTVPFIVKLVLEMPEHFPSGLPMVNTADEAIQEVSLSKQQCASLLACSFFCGYHHTSVPTKKTVNLDNIYISLNKKCPQNIAKLCMLMNYFERCRLSMYDESQDIVIKRYHNLNPITRDQWVENTLPLTQFEVFGTGSINDAGSETLHVDFANRWIGGGVLNRGSVQEEIMFSICPELLTTIHICGVMDQNEAIVITGAEEFSLHKGYSRNLQFIGNTPPSEDDAISRVAMDATRFTGERNSMRQYSEETILRELNKVYVAFNNDSPTAGSPVATGNWGCGAFGGHIQLKSMLQWIAASSCSRAVKYYTFQDPNCKGLEEIVEILMRKNLTVGKLFEAIVDFSDQVEPSDNPKDQLFAHLKDTFDD